MRPQSALRGLSGDLGREQRNPMGSEKGAEIALDCDPYTPFLAVACGAMALARFYSPSDQNSVKNIIYLERNPALQFFAKGSKS
jgi:hypothetical protein